MKFGRERGGVDKSLVVLLAFASIGTTVLIVLGVALMNQRGRQATLRPVLPEVGMSEREPEGNTLDIALPGFELIDQNDETFVSESMRGKVWIVDFVFTTCPGLCPAMTAQMVKVQGMLDVLTETDSRYADVKIVSVSVDPEQDRPEQLRAYMEKYGADPERWTFLTGERSSIWDLIHDGFLLNVDENPEFRETGEGTPIVHSPRFGLIDTELKLRGYFSVLRPHGMDDLFAALEELMDE